MNFEVFFGVRPPLVSKFLHGFPHPKVKFTLGFVPPIEAVHVSETVGVINADDFNVVACSRVNEEDDYSKVVGFCQRRVASIPELVLATAIRTKVN
uniref:hypothetical protein n=1 Tax=Halorussus ruber TaxID=1126238 RepID=UPI001091CA4D|nr:hypothetical protein [Halorussus ruber]